LTDGVPTVDAYSPATQLSHAVHDIALLVVLYSPAAQGSQLRLAMLEPAANWNSPGVQVLHTAQLGALAALL
jgi:hypothetical protein